jgi:hypothetical protein
VRASVMAIMCRTTIFSNYAEENCPGAGKLLPTICVGAGQLPQSSEPAPGPWWSLMFEISESQYKPVSWRETVEIGGKMWPKVVLDTLQGALNTKLIRDTDEIVSIYHRRCVLTRPGCWVTLCFVVPPWRLPSSCILSMQVAWVAAALDPCL